MKDEEIIEKCMIELDKHRSISAKYIITEKLKLEYNASLIRRIENTITEDNRYILNGRRIRFNPEFDPKSWKERNWFIVEIFRGVVILFATLGAALLLNIWRPMQKEDKSKSSIEKPIEDSSIHH